MFLLRQGYHTHTPHPSTQTLTWQHGINSLAHGEQVDGSTQYVKYIQGT